jgi:hypothetical protein
VRRILLVLLAALALQLCVAQAALADTTSTSAPPTTAAPTTAAPTTIGATTTTMGAPTTIGATTTTTSATTTTTGATTTSAPTTTAAQTTTTAPGPIGVGRFARQPASGPALTQIHVASITPCPAPEGATAPEVDVVLVDPQNETEAGLLAEAVFPIDDTGAWSGVLTVPAGTAPGSYLLFAACFPDASFQSEPYFLYEPNGFTVTPAAGAPPARPAAPVEFEPDFAG